MELDNSVTSLSSLLLNKNIMGGGRNKKNYNYYPKSNLRKASFLSYEIDSYN